MRLLDRDALHEGVEEPLGAAIDGVARLAVYPAFGARADDIAAGPAQMRQREFGHQEGRADVAADLLVELLDRHVVGLGIGGEHTGIVDQDVELAEIVDRRIDARERGGLVGDVTGEGDRPAAIRVDIGDDVIDRVAGQAVDDDPCALAGEFAGDGLADPGAASRDDGDLSFEMTSHGNLRAPGTPASGAWLLTPGRAAPASRRSEAAARSA